MSCSINIPFTLCGWMIEIVGLIYRHIAVGMILSSYILSIELQGGILILGSILGICWMIWGRINRKMLLLCYITVTFLMIIFDIITLFASFPLMNKLTVNIWPMKGMHKEFINGLYTIYSSCCNNYPEDVKDSCKFFSNICIEGDIIHYAVNKLNKYTIPVIIILVLAIVIEILVNIGLFFVKFPEAAKITPYPSKKECVIECEKINEKQCLKVKI